MWPNTCTFRLAIVCVQCACVSLSVYNNTFPHTPLYMVLYSMIELESTPFDGAAAEHSHAVHVVSVRLGYVHAGV